MCNRTDCAGSWAGPMACAVCREMDMADKCKALHDFLSMQHVSFETMVRCYNFWSSLTDAQKDQYIKAYENGEVKSCGPYGLTHLKRKKASAQ